MLVVKKLSIASLKVTQFEGQRSIGLDVTPYLTPPSATLTYLCSTGVMDAESTALLMLVNIPTLSGPPGRVLHYGVTNLDVPVISVVHIPSYQT